MHGIRQYILVFQTLASVNFVKTLWISYLVIVQDFSSEEYVATTSFDFLLGCSPRQNL